MEEMNSLADLLDLQDIDLQIDRLLNERQSLPALAEYRAAHTREEDLKTRVGAAEAALRETTLGFDKTSGELDIAAAKLESEQNRLYAGGLSARDADYMRREVEMLGRKKVEMEDSLLALMELREEQEQALETLQGELAAATEGKATLEAVIQEAWRGIDVDLARKEARKAEIVPLIPEDLLELYEELRPAKEGVAIGRLVESVCGGCHLRLTAAERLDVTRSDPPRCIHCRRILVL
jgi:predicted  nucleic acid-binding Zn-ribbon protein